MKEEFFEYAGISFRMLLREEKVVQVAPYDTQAGEELSYDELRGYELDLSAFTPFEKEVMERVRAIPLGKVATYGGVARAVKREGAARAVGGVMARNPFTVLVPCHRVVGSDLKTGNYSYGPDVKLRLLRKEGVVVREGRIREKFLFKF